MWSLTVSKTGNKNELEFVLWTNSIYIVLFFCYTIDICQQEY